MDIIFQNLFVEISLALICLFGAITGFRLSYMKPYLYGDNNNAVRHVAGPFGILGFTPHLFLLTETDFQQSTTKGLLGITQTGAVSYQRLSYEIIQGVLVFLTFEYSQLDFQNSQTISRSFGPGFQFFPHPHFELEATWQKQQAVAASSNYTDLAWILFHVYL